MDFFSLGSLLFFLVFGTEQAIAYRLGSGVGRIEPILSSKIEKRYLNSIPNDPQISLRASKVSTNRAHIDARQSPIVRNYMSAAKTRSTKRFSAHGKTALLPYNRATPSSIQSFSSSQSRSLPFSQTATQQDLKQATSQALKVLEEAKSANVVPQIYIDHLAGFVQDYGKESAKSGNISAGEYLEMMRTLMESIKGCSKFNFEVFHQAVREPFDYYHWGKKLWTHLIDFQNSKFAGSDNIEEIRGLLNKGENVFLLSNHQIEPDSYMVRIALEHLGFEDLSERLILIAGHRVRSDPLTIPFSMGCNLICVHSKKHILSDPSQTGDRRQQNLLAMQTLQNLLSEGGRLIWVAPSGGRDRPPKDQEGMGEKNEDIISSENKDSKNCHYVISPFDIKTNQMFRVMSAKSGRKAHFYPTALSTAAICPPPKEVATNLGEARSCAYSPIGFGVGASMTEFESTSASIFSAEAQRRTQELYNSIEAHT